MNSEIDSYLVIQREKLNVRKQQIQQMQENNITTESKDTPLDFTYTNNDKNRFISLNNHEENLSNYNHENANEEHASPNNNMDLSQPIVVDLNSSQKSKSPNFLSSICSKKLEHNKNPFDFYDEILQKYSRKNDDQNSSSDSCKSPSSDHSVHYKKISADEMQTMMNNLSKSAKNRANQKEIEDRSDQNSARSRKSQGDMEPWISDKFYSYFPSFNEEEQKRQNLMRDRQFEYRNYLNQASEEPKKSKQSSINKDTKSNRNTFRTDKTDLEIIVNNPTYTTTPSNKDNLPRPGSARHKLLQDLMHTNLSNIVNSNAVQERNQRSTELEQKKKKEYQQELLSQIEEKRREIAILKEKEKRDEELAERKLKEHFKTLKLNEGKERDLIKKTNLDNEHNTVVRKLHLPTDFKNEYKSVSADGYNKESTAQDDNNKVYKYFSNSARNYENERYTTRRDNLFESLESNIGQDQFSKQSTAEAATMATAQNDCTHLDKLLCTFCDMKLKNYESWCKKCQSQILDDGVENRSILCESCKDQYLICSACEKQNYPCNFCRRKRNICLHCITNYCIHCGRSIRDLDLLIDTTKTKTSSKGGAGASPSGSGGIGGGDNSINDAGGTSSNKTENRTSKPSSERSFQILEVSHPPESEDNLDENDFLDIDCNRKVPYSINLHKNSIFHPSNKITEPKIEVNVENGEISVNNFWKGKNFNEIKEQTSNRLDRYLSNYSDLAIIKKSKNISTQTKAIRDRDSPRIYQDELPSMPLLREIPKRKDFIMKETLPVVNVKNDKIKTLTKKWEVPAVQRMTVSKTSPRVLTQVGAFKKQLQAEDFELEG